MGFIVLRVNIAFPAAFILWLWRHRGEENLFWVSCSAIGSSPPCLDALFRSTPVGNCRLEPFFVSTATGCNLP